MTTEQQLLFDLGQIKAHVENLKRENAELRARPSAAKLTREFTDEDADKIKAFNLLLTAVNPTVRTLAERYLEGVKDLEAFVQVLRDHPLNMEPK